MCQQCEKFSKNLLKKNRGVALPINLSSKMKKRVIGDYIKVKSEYHDKLIGNMQLLTAGRITKDDYLTMQKEAMKLAFTEAYANGKVFGQGHYNGVDETERRFIGYQVNREMEYMSKFADDIITGSGKMPYVRRMGMYSDGLDAMFGFGRLVYMPDEAKILWNLGETDKHCLDCIVFNAKNPYTKKTLPGYPKSGASRCFVGKLNSYKILTPDGWKNFGEIKIGDYVLSHNHKWKRVLNVINESCEDEYCYEITLKTATNKKLLKYNMLYDHKSISNGDWVDAENLKIGDKLLITGHKCKYCGDIITYDDPRAINFDYCCHSCSSKGCDKWASGRKQIVEKYGKLGATLEEWRKNDDNIKMSIEIGRTALKAVHESRIGKTYEEMYGKERAEELKKKCTEKAHEKTRELSKLGIHVFQKFMRAMTKEKRSEFCKNARSKMLYADFINYVEENTKEKLKNGKFKFTKPEKMMQNLLTEIGLDFIPQQRLGNYFYDYYLPKYDIYIEVDGDFIHSNPKFYNDDSLKLMQRRQKIKDIAKNQTINAHGKQLFRFWEDDIKNNREFVINKLKMILNNHDENFVTEYREIVDIKKVKISELNGKRMLSLTVEDDESYTVTGGLIAHNCLSNCKCSLLYLYSNTMNSGDYDTFIVKNYNQKGELPSEEQYFDLMSMRNEFYYNKGMYAITGMRDYQDNCNSIRRRFSEYKTRYNLYISDAFPVRRFLGDIKEFNSNTKFSLVTSSTDVNANDMISFFAGDKQIYGKVVNNYNKFIRIRLMDKSELMIDPKSAILFREK